MRAHEMNASAANLALIQAVAVRLGPLRTRVVFLGGATIALLITDHASASIRGTDDVDVIVEVSSYGEYQHALRDELLRVGFREDNSPGAPRCRWIVDGIKVDVMPTHESVLGFSNRWYPAAIKHSTIHTLANGVDIRVVTGPYLLATKLEAFRGRGNDDYHGSRDIEDLVTIIDGRPSIIDDVSSADPLLRAHLAGELAQLLDTEAFIDALPGHVLGDDINQARVPIIENRLRRLAGRS